MDKREALIRRYFDACNAADHDALVACFTPDAVHYFPPGLPGAPWRGADAIAKGWIWCVETLGSRWTIERVLLGPADGGPEGVPEAVIEWTHWKSKQNTALRGDEWYRFDPGSGLISEIRAYYASPAQPGVPINTAVSDGRKSMPDQHVSVHMPDAAKLLILRALGSESDTAVLMSCTSSTTPAGATTSGPAGDAAGARRTGPQDGAHFLRRAEVHLRRRPVG